MTVALLIIGLILFVGLVIVHEFGHFIAARRNNVDVEEFAIGFPPRAWSKRLKSGLLFSVNYLPLGGFVRLKGEHDADRGKGTYGAANIRSKSKIMLAGVGMNLLAAWLILTILGWVGMPRVLDNQFVVTSDSRVIKNQVLVGYVEEGSPAQQAGIKPRDNLRSFMTTAQQETKIENAAMFPDLTKQYAGQKIQLKLDRQGNELTVQVQLRSAQEVEASKQTDNPKGYLGVVPTEYTLERSTWSAPVMAVGFMVQVTKATLHGLWLALSGLLSWNTAQATSQVAGPVGIFVLLKDGSLMGPQFVLLIVAIISLTLAIMNTLPIPALDGGRLFVTWLFRFLRKPLTPRMEELIHGTGFAALMLLFVLITVVDVRRFF